VTLGACRVRARRVRARDLPGTALDELRRHGEGHEIEGSVRHSREKSLGRQLAHAERILLDDRHPRVEQIEQAHVIEPDHRDPVLRVAVVERTDRADHHAVVRS